MPFAPVNGTEIYYEDHGNGFPVVFAHGAGGNHLSWWQQVPAFSRRYRCITFDHRGWGLTPDPAGTGPAAFVDDLEALLGHLGIVEAALVGQSMGGYTCLLFALAQPGRVRGLVMANTFAGMRREVWLAAGEELRAGAHGIWERRRSEGVKRALARDFSARNRHLAFLYKEIRLLNESGPNRLDAAAQVARLRALERTPETSATASALAAVDFPVLFVGGEHDEVMPAGLMEVAASLVPGSRMVVVPGAAHSVYFEAAETFNQIALEFLPECTSVT
jgi:3-oxoadipate enol-lactonase